MDRYRIIADDLTGPQVVALLQLHLDEMHQWSPPDSVHAMPVERLRQPDVSFYSAWDGDRLACVGAIKRLDGARGELKSMRAHPDFRRAGAGKAILLHLLDVARDRGYHWVGLETGTPEPFVPARNLYLGHGFVPCEPFADYVADDFSVCMERVL
jgi:putative acetyltransferase